MKKQQKTNFITRDIMKSALKDSFIKLSPRTMMKNPVMFVVEVGCVITILLGLFPALTGAEPESYGTQRIFEIGRAPPSPPVSEKR